MSDSYYTTITMTKEEYETVAGYSLGPAPRNGQGSGGYYEQDIVILYYPTAEGGITGISWYTEDKNSPFHDAIPTEIEAHYLKYQNLNSYFSKWGSNPAADRGHFLKNTISDSCWDFPSM